MKKIIFCILGFVICTSFNKHNSLTNYRDACTGAYFCNRVCNRWHAPERIYTSDTISISITKDAIDSIVNINIEQQVFKIKLLNKTLQAYPKSGHYGGKFFATDSIDFYFASGRAFSCTLKGKKK